MFKTLQLIDTTDNTISFVSFNEYGELYDAFYNHDHYDEIYEITPDAIGLVSIAEDVHCLVIGTTESFHCHTIYQLHEQPA